ncbi:MAG: hypothetical protein HY887_03840 [Deltaproteobacteria bacterium]|nr:hypothetical protein [Deltaproteobacteria bacterium]
MGKTVFIDIFKGVQSAVLSGRAYIFGSEPSGCALESEYDFADTDGLKTITSKAEDAEYFLSLPLDSLNFRLFNFSFTDRAKIRRVIPYEIDGLIMGGSGSVVYDFAVSESPSGGYDALVVYAEKGVIDGLLSNMAAIGIDPKALTCIELRLLTAGGINDFGERIMNAPEIAPDERKRLAAAELVAPGINLRTGPFAYTKDTEKAGRTLKITAALAILLALSINAGFAFSALSARKDANAMNKEIRQAYTGLFPEDRKITDELYQLKSRMREVNEKADAVIGVSPIEFLLSFSSSGLSGVAINEITVDKKRISIKGEAGSASDLESIKSLLQGAFTEVTVSEVGESSGNRLSFTVIAKAGVK